MGRDRKRGKSNKGWKSPAQSGSNQKKRRQGGGWNDDLELEFQFYNNGVKPAKENKSQRRHSLPATFNDKPSAFRKFKGSPVASLRNPVPVYNKKPSPAPRRNNTYAYDYSNYEVDENVHTLQNDDVEDLTRAYVKMAVKEDDSSSSDSSELSGSESDSCEAELNSDGEYDYNDLLNYDDSSGEGGKSDEFDDLDSDDDEHESDDEEGEDMDTDEEAEEEALETEEQQEEEIEGNPVFFIDKTADITILNSLELSQSRDDVLQTPEAPLKSSAKMRRPKSTSEKITIVKNKKQPIVVYAPSDKKKKNRVTAKVMRNIGELEKWFSDGNGSSEEDSDEVFDKEAVLDYLQNVSPTHRQNFLGSKSFEMYEDYDSPDENITQSQLNIPKRASAKVDRQDKNGKLKKGKKEFRERKEAKMLRGPRGERSSKKKGHSMKYSKPVSWVQGQSLQDMVEEEYKEFAETVAALHTDNNNNTTDVIVDVDIIVDTVQNTPQGKSKKDKKGGKKKGKKEGFDAKKLNNINDNIQVLVDTDSLKELPMEHMNRTQRLQVLKLAACYNVKGISKGSGKRKYLVLVKTPHTYYCDETTVKQAIREAVAINSDPTVRAKGEKFIPNFTPTKRAPLQKGRIVAEHASPIDDNNLGNRLLRGMGWSGGGLGANGQGIAAPVVATIKHDKRGLGF